MMIRTLRVPLWGCGIVYHTGMVVGSYRVGVRTVGSIGCVSCNNE
ncbi:hypothetical protein [Pasteuria penetrans]|nr:hypothetical protein [Pasteuria penetrans]